jgi:hypothetical protein
MQAKIEILSHFTKTKDLSKKPFFKMNSKICQKCDFLIIFTTENVIFYMELLERKIDKFLIEWKQNPARKPLIVNGS